MTKREQGVTALQRTACNRGRLGCRIIAGLFLLCVFAPGCHSSQGTADEESGLPTYVPLPGDSAHNVSIEELDRQVGFRFVLPSYLPETMSNNYLAFSNEHSAGESDYTEGRVLIVPQADSLVDLQIEIYERRPAAGEPKRGLPSDQLIDISQVTVHCVLEPAAYVGTPTPFPTDWPPMEFDPEEARHPQFSCYWDTDELYFDVDFRWALAKPLPGLITSEMRDEAMKVVTSMIEDPYVP